MENWFKQREGSWDREEPGADHTARFFEKLKANAPSIMKSETESKVLSLKFYWKPLAVAASLMIIFSLGFLNHGVTTERELAEVSPKMEETQDFFTNAIEQQLYDVKAQNTPETNKMVDDALIQLEVLEQDYKKLKTDLAKSGEDKRVVYAMIANFQTRIDLLKNVMLQMDELKTIKSEDHEKKSL